MERPATRCLRGLSYAGVGSVVAIALGAMVLGGFSGDWRPSHFDEWRSIALAERFIQSGALTPETPVGSPNGLARDISDRNRSLGFVAIVAAWLQLAPEPIRLYKGLALLFLLIYGAGVYSLSRKLGTGRWAALFGALTLASLPTDTMLLGPALAVPSSLSLGLLCFALVAHLDLSAKEPAWPRGSIALLVATTGLLAVTYLLNLVVFGALVALDTLCRPALARTHYLRSLAAIGFLGLLILLAREAGSVPDDATGHLGKLLLLDQRWHLVSVIAYTVDYMVAPPVLALASVGALLSLRRPSHFWVAATFLGPLAALGGYVAWEKGLLIPYQRLGLYLGMGAALCAALGVQQILVGLRRSGPGSAWIRAVALALLALVVMAWPRPAPPFPRTTRLDRPGPALEVLARRIASSYGPPTTVWAAPGHAMYLEALTGLQIAPSALDALLTGHAPPALDCEAGWDLVVGPCPCPNYTLAFAQSGVPVFVRTEPPVGTRKNRPSRP
ncbi:MAG: hypothetical protein P8Q97_12225 [Myxococcota bacterium]|nr:hypothetical protein [Myxococcota bacterium]